MKHEFHHDSSDINVLIAAKLSLAKDYSLEKSTKTVGTSSPLSSVMLYYTVMSDKIIALTMRHRRTTFDFVLSDLWFIHDHHKHFAFRTNTSVIEYSVRIFTPCLSSNQHAYFSTISSLTKVLSPELYIQNIQTPSPLSSLTFPVYPQRPF